MDSTAIAALIERQRRFFETGQTRDLEFRIERLRALKEAIRRHEAEIFDALRQDLRKSEFESYATEIGFMYADIDHTIKHLPKWAKPKRVPTPLTLQPATCQVYRDPLGQVLVIGAWNYPFQLVMAPLTPAIAAGNCAILKPSELAPKTSALVAKLVAATFDPGHVAAVEGGVQETQALLDHRFDHVFFTGSTRVGRIIMQAAAKHMSPVTLELGGKSPCIIDRDAKLDVAARRIVWGKFVNAGQTCVAPDYLLVQRGVKDALVDRIRATVGEFYGPDPKASPDYPRIISQRHFARLLELMRDGRVIVGGDSDPEQLYIGPTLLDQVKQDGALMEEEIFGPLLPVLEVDDLQEAVRFINARPKPLALYYFTEDGSRQERVLRDTTSGGVCINDCMVHLGAPDLPFGGVGDSGIGAYHGRTGFNTFSHRKATLKKPTWVDPKIRYAPYKDNLKYLRWVIG